MNNKITITSPEQFKTVLWKNGLGETIEVAINEGGALEHFDWRLSMASVVEDGLFSKFTDYTRNIVLIEGNGISLQHNDNKIDKLNDLLDIATFDGGNKTVGNLHAGDVTCFNIITRTNSIKTKVSTAQTLNKHKLEQADYCFIYSLYRDAELTINTTNNVQEMITLPAKHLLKITNNSKQLASITGAHLIIISLLHKPLNQPKHVISCS